jgi:integrase
MIHRQNWLDVRAYLRYLDRVRQLAPESVIRSRAHLRHLLEWADETPLSQVAHISPTLPAYILAARSDGRTTPLSPSSIKKGLENARGFYRFARDQWPNRYRHIKLSWIEMLQPPRGSRLSSHLVVHQFYTLEDVLKIASVSVETLRQERCQVAAAMLFLSGMRADALATLPISCVDIDRREIRQFPELGVRTKNRKAAITYMLEIPELLTVVAHWDQRVRTLPRDALWYSTLTRDGMTLTSTVIPHLGRGDLIERDLHIACRLASLPYLSPHKLRHGHVVYALKQSKTMAELKAISQNVMHSSVTITDQVYGQLVDNDVRRIIGGLGNNSASFPAEKLAELLEILKALQPAGISMET